MLSCIIIDDELHCIDALSAIIKKKFSDKIKVIGSTVHPKDAAELIKRMNPDVVFLDIEMPNYNGMQILSHFPEKNFAVVFTTAYDKYALQALKADATDYLLKPINIGELQAAIEKCITQKTLGYNKNEWAEEKFPRQKIMLASTKGILLADIKDIVRIEANNNYCTFYFINKPKITMAKTLKEFEEYLKYNNFFRVHQSHMVNLLYVESYESGLTDYVVLSNNEKIEISRRRKAEFLEKLSSL
jgi:two-component system LytT family response regulator